MDPPQNHQLPGDGPPNWTAMQSRDYGDARNCHSRPGGPLPNSPMDMSSLSAVDMIKEPFTHQNKHHPPIHHAITDRPSIQPYIHPPSQPTHTALTNPLFSHPPHHHAVELAAEFPAGLAAGPVVVTSTGQQRSRAHSCHQHGSAAWVAAADSQQGP
jgi:hypothetical protein